MASIQGVGRHWTLFKVPLWISSASCTTTWGSQGVSFPAKPVIHSRCVCCLRFLSSHPTCFLLIKIRTCFPDCLAAALVVAWGETSNTNFIPDVSSIRGSSTNPWNIYLNLWILRHPQTPLCFWSWSNFTASMSKDIGQIYDLVEAKTYK